MAANIGANSHEQSFRQEPIFQGERIILSEFVRPGMRVLDVGCAATGRTARLLRDLGCTVCSIDIDICALAEFQTRAEQGIHLAAGDMCTMPFASGSFDLVLIAFHGIDYLLTADLRSRVFQEVDRVLSPRGAFVFSSLNRIGVVLSPSGFCSRREIESRFSHLWGFGFLKPTLVDVNGLTLYQSSPRRVIVQVETCTDLEFVGAINPSGTSRNLLLLTLFAIGPYYSFTRSRFGHRSA